MIVSKRRDTFELAFQKKKEYPYLLWAARMYHTVLTQ